MRKNDNYFFQLDIYGIVVFAPKRTNIKNQIRLTRRNYKTVKTSARYALEAADKDLCCEAPRI